MIRTTANRENGMAAWAKKALPAGLLMAAMVAASLLAPAPAYASAFPGANGKIAFASDRTTGPGVNNPEGDLEIFSVNPDGTGLKQLTKNTKNDAAPSFSPDGKTIVFQSLRTGDSEVFKMSAGGKGQANLTKNPANDLRPSFSPDGKKVLFDSERNGANNADVFVMNSDGTGQKALTTDPANDTSATFSPKGGEIAFMSNRGGDFEVFKMNTNGTGQAPLTANDFQDENPSFSPDGSKIAFDSDRDGQGDPNDFDIFVMNSTDGSGTSRLTNSRATDIDPAFSPDGTKIAYASNQDGGDRDVLVMDAANGTNLTDITPNSDSDDTPEWQPTATFTVTSAADTGIDGVCDSNCTLREAINASNAPKAQSRSTIRFDIPGGGVQTITPQSDLPSITRPVTIDGYTQPGASPNTLAKGTNAAPKIELSGTDAIGADGLDIQGSSNSVIRGLVINDFVVGIRLQPGSAANRIEGNFLGTDPTGTLHLGNENGVLVNGASGNVIGGNTSAARNLISGNENTGIDLTDNSQGNRVLGNLIGTTASGAGSLGNAFGVGLASVSVSNNKIGDGTSAGSNTIAFNANGGIVIVDQGGTRNNPISRNSIFSNVGLGIDLVVDLALGPNANDPGDADTGANDLQNFPILTSAKTASGQTTVTGKLNSTPGKSFKVEFFSNPFGTDEGKTFIGQKTIITDSNGDVAFTKALPKVAVGQTITATAAGPGGNTSEFSAPRKVVAS